MTCSRCKKSFGGVLAALTADIGRPALCPACEAAEKQRRRELAARAKEILLTTTPTVEGHRVVAYLGIESVEIVIGTGFLSELTGDISDFLGQRSTVFESKLREAKDAAFRLMQHRAAEKGADAVIGIDLDYTEFSGNRIGLILNGTIVRLDPVPKSASPKQPIVDQNTWADV
jgi:uncharacterized protein YbjQ (UPF0145 family)